MNGKAARQNNRLLATCLEAGLRRPRLATSSAASSVDKPIGRIPGGSLRQPGNHVSAKLILPASQRNQ